MSSTKRLILAESLLRRNLTLRKNKKSQNANNLNNTNIVTEDDLFKFIENREVAKFVNAVNEWEKTQGQNVMELFKLAADEQEIGMMDEELVKDNFGDLSLEGQKENEESENYHILMARKRVKRTTLLMHCCEFGCEELIYQVFTDEKYLPVLSTLCNYINAKDINDCDALTVACRKNRTELALHLLNSGADINNSMSGAKIQQVNVNSCFWYWIVKHNNERVVEAVLSILMAKQNVLNNGKTLSEIKDRNGFRPTNFFDVNAKIFENQSSAVIYAVKHGFEGMFKLLFHSKLVDLYQKDGFGKNALDYAYYYGRDNIISVLEGNVKLASKYKNVYLSRANLFLGLQSYETNFTLKKLQNAAKSGDLRTIKTAFGISPSGAPYLRGNEKEIKTLCQVVLSEAVEANDAEIVAFFLSQDAFTFSQDELLNWLQFASVNGYAVLFESLFKKLAEVVDNIQNLQADIKPIFNDAVDKERSEIIEAILTAFSETSLQVALESIKLSAERGLFRSLDAIMKSMGGKGFPGGFLQGCFVTAVTNLNVGTMKSLIENGFNANLYISFSKKDRSDQVVTLWEYALTQPSTNILKALLTCYEKVDINCSVSQNFGSPLLLATKWKNIDALRLFLDKTKPWYKTVRTNCTDNQHYTPLYYVVEKTKSNESDDRLALSKEILKLLLENDDTNVNHAKGVLQFTVLQSCENDELAFQLIRSDRVDMLQINNCGFNTLNQMCHEGRYKQIEFVLQHFAQKPGFDLPGLVNTQDAEGQTPIMRCASLNRRTEIQNKQQVENFVKCAEILLNCPGIDLNVRDIYGRTLFIYAAGVGRHYRNSLPETGDVLDLLLRYHSEKGVNVGLDHVDTNGNTGLVYACFEANVRSVELLLRHLTLEQISRVNNFGASAFEEAISSGRMEVIEALMKYDVNINGRPVSANGIMSGRTPLIRACLNNHHDAVKLILQHKDFDHLHNVNVIDLASGCSALHITIKQTKNVLILKDLLDLESIDVNLKEIGTGLTPLMLASQRNVPENIFRMVLEDERVLVNVQDVLGESVLIKCVKEYNVRYVMLLLERIDIDVNCIDASGKNIMHHAVETGKQDLIQLIVTWSKGRLNLASKDKEGVNPSQLSEDLLQNQNRRRGSGVDFIKVNKLLSNQGSLTGKKTVIKKAFKNANKVGVKKLI